MGPAPAFVLRHEEPWARPLDLLTARTGRVGLQGVLADLDRTARPVQVPGRAAVEGFTWEHRDDDDARWFPQGVAVAGGSVDGRQVMLVSWYARRDRWGRTHGSRVTVVDRTDPDRPRYRHVLLVDTSIRWRRLALHRVPIHAGGIVVHGHRLLVADTHAGLRAFDLRDVVRLPARPIDRLAPWSGAGTRTIGHRLTGGFTAFGHAYVLPQRGAYRVQGGGPRRLRYSFGATGVVDGGHRLVVGEYGRKGQTTRLVEYPFDPETGGPALDADGSCVPLAIHDGQPHRMQGVAVAGGRYFVTASAGEGNPGTLWVGAPGRFHPHRGVLPTGCEDLDSTADGSRLWCTTEWPGRRVTFALDPTAW